MTKKRKRRIIILCVFMLGVSCATALILYALRQNISLFYTPSELLTQNELPKQQIRIGGMVQAGSLHYAEDLSLNFIVTDFKHNIKVQYTGVLPDLFKEGQGVVALGKLQADQTFLAEQILAKHDENYMPYKK